MHVQSTFKFFGMSFWMNVVYASQGFLLALCLTPLRRGNPTKPGLGQQPASPAIQLLCRSSPLQSRYSSLSHLCARPYAHAYFLWSFHAMAAELHCISQTSL